MPTDLSKALDSLHHGRLVTKKLEIYEFSNMSLELMHSYFMERKNCVRVNNMTSTWKDQFRGARCTTRALLWNLFQNSLSLNVHISNLLIYADDHQVYQSGSNTKAILRILGVNIDISSVSLKRTSVKKRIGK